ncbi:MAG: DUF2062 domain-containing protein [Rhodobacterales bacterium]|jgi:uncharacterized protein|nr:DUF2062 domain-containing protein [Pseudomonadota bacterium]
MVFKRRKKLSYGRWIAEAFYPRSGWKRAASYIWHRLRRLPDTPHKIARGVGIGVFISFTPFFGFHFVAAVLLSLLIRGNALAALLATFFGNPITFPFIAGASLTLGHWILQDNLDPTEHKSLLRLFAQAAGDFWYKFKALFGGASVDWSNLQDFMMQVFLPYLVGGFVPGVILGIVGYFLTVPVITAYQKRRRGKLVSRWKERRSKHVDHVQ